MTMTPEAARRIRILAGAIAILVAGALMIAGLAYARMRASLPQLDGIARVAELAYPASIQRDALGVPTIRGAGRTDVACGLGYAHAQDRFFQMDLLRRRAAGELAELIGKAALPLDKNVRRHGFRAAARAAVGRLEPGERAVLEAYAAGVNAGLSSLGAKPFEYYILRADPQPWRPEDCILINCAMILTLQDDAGRYEHTLDTLRETYGAEGLAFFAPLETPEDAALDGSTAPLPPIPGPRIVNLRAAEEPGSAPAAAQTAAAGRRPPRAGALAAVDEFIPGSNSFAIAGNRTATGAALLENDMHLDFAVPNTWYRVSLAWGPHRVTGITVPGAPMVVAGSNGRVAWGFTSADTDDGDLVRVTRTASPNLYQGPGDSGLLPFDRRKETILVKGADPVTVEFRWTVWGPIVGTDTQGRELAYRWVFDDRGAIDIAFMAMEGANDVDQALAIAQRAGLPSLNFLVADSAGHVGWTIAGRLPNRVGFDGRLPASWVFGDRRWDGFLPPGNVPVVKDPPGSVLWTANNRILGGRALGLLGDGAYDRPARAAQIRDDLEALAARSAATPRDLLDIALDDRAAFLSRWRLLLLGTLTPQVVGRDSSRAELRALADDWGGRASIDSAGFRLVRAFREAVVRRVLDPIFAPCSAADPGFNYRRLHYDDAVWALVHEKPRHLLSPLYATWDDLLAAAADDAVAEASRDGVRLRAATWGRINILRMNHPFSRMLPGWLAGRLSMPAEPLPGDNDMPRVQTPTHGSSERFVVSPGHEDQGIFEMPGGQSGHPLSPYYRAGHEAWARGEPTPFLPGRTEHTLTLAP